MTDKPHEGSNTEAVLRGLVAIDNNLRLSSYAASPAGADIAPPGSGLHTLIEHLAKLFLGVTPLGYPAKPDEPPAVEVAAKEEG